MTMFAVTVAIAVTVHVDVAVASCRSSTFSTSTCTVFLFFSSSAMINVYTTRAVWRAPTSGRPSSAVNYANFAPLLLFTRDLRPKCFPNLLVGRCRHHRRHHRNSCQRFLLKLWHCCGKWSSNMRLETMTLIRVPNFKHMHLLLSEAFFLCLLLLAITLR